MAFSDVWYYISFFIGVSSLSLHIIVIYVILLSSAHRLFKGVFWQIYAINSLYAVFMSLLYDILHRWRSEPLVAHIVLNYLPSKGFVPMLFIALFNISCVGKAYTSLLINFNRFTVLYLKQKHTAFWNRYLVWFNIFILLVQVVAASNAWLVDVRITPEKGTQYYKWDGSRTIPYFQISMLNFFNAVFSTAISMVFTVYIVISLILHRKTLVNEFQIKKSDIKLCLFSAIMFVGSCGVTFSQLAFVLGAAKDLSYQQIMVYQSYFIDLSLYMPPWALLGTSTVLWNTTRALLCCSLGKNPTGLSSTVVKTHSMFEENHEQHPRR